MDIFLSFLSLCHARNLVHVYLYACHTHPSIHPSIHPCNPYTTIHTTSAIVLLLGLMGIAIVAALLLFPSPRPPTPLLPACLPFSLHPKTLPLLLLLLYFKYQSFAAAAAALFFSRRWTFCCEIITHFFSFLAIYQVLGITIRYSPDALLLLLLLCLDCFLFLSGGSNNLLSLFF